MSPEPYKTLDMPNSLKAALKVGLARLKKDVEILQKIPSKDYPLADLRVTVDILELVMQEVREDIPYEARPLSVGLYFGTKEVELGKVQQYGNGKDAKTKEDDGKPRP